MSNMARNAFSATLDLGLGISILALNESDDWIAWFGIILLIAASWHSWAVFKELDRRLGE